MDERNKSFRSRRICPCPIRLPMLRPTCWKMCNLTVRRGKECGDRRRVGLWEDDDFADDSECASLQWDDRKRRDFISREKCI